jgi:hypothetical protein
MTFKKALKPVLFALKKRSRLLFFIFSPFCFQLFSMNDGKKPSNVIHLSDLESKAKKELEAAEETLDKLPRSWGESTNQVAIKIHRTKKRHNKLQEINKYQSTQNPPPPPTRLHKPALSTCCCTSMHSLAEPLPK